MSSPRLTLTMIVKNEAELLPKFIRSIQGLADEWIVVDTGSTDSTVKLLEEAGAHILHHVWQNDFSKARNVGLEKASGDWVMFLDADEFISPEAVRQTRALLSNSRLGAATFEMVNQLPHGHARKTPLLRLFRRHPTLRFQHAIHEDITDGVSAMLKATGTHLFHVNAPIEHVGYIRSLAHARGKKARDVSLLENCLKENAYDFYLHFKLLEQARFWEDTTLWQKAARHAYQKLNEAGRPCLAQSHYGGELIVLVSQGLGHGTQETLSYLDTWANFLSPSAAFRLKRAECLEQLGRLSDARTEFQICLKENASFGNHQLSSVRPLLGLTRIEMAQGNWVQAFEYSEAALLHQPRDPEALLAGASLSRVLDSRNGLAKWTQRRLSHAEDSFELRQALGEEASLRRDFQTAVMQFEKAAQLAPDETVLVRLAQCHLALGHFETSLEVLTSHGLKNPEATIGQVLLKVLQAKDSDVTLECSQEVADGAIKRWTSSIMYGSDVQLKSQLRDFAPSLQTSFPWLPSWLATQFEPPPSS